MSDREVTVDPLRAWLDDRVWGRKLEDDSKRIERCLPSHIRDLHRAVVDRARASGAHALILSGSTARGRRTEISDLDYHLVGSTIDTDDLSRELDLHVLSAKELEVDVLAGDDFVQWSLRFGCVVFDDGAVRSAVRLLVERRRWPDVDRKRAHAARSLELARRFVATGDEDGALEQVRTALSMAARARLLAEGIFPLSRAELPTQLQQIGEADAARALGATIHGTLSLPELEGTVRHGERLLVASGHSTNGQPSSVSLASR